jgi:hypothetical protein
MAGGGHRGMSRFLRRSLSTRPNLSRWSRTSSNSSTVPLRRLLNGFRPSRRATRSLAARSVEGIAQHIRFLRGHRVMLAHELAEPYGVQPRVLIQAVARNRERFPADFMFQLTWDEAARSRSQVVILNEGRGANAKYRPYAFTEHGVAMLSSVLRSERAIQVNIAIMRTFGRLRALLAGHQDLARKLSELEHRYDAQFKVVFDAIRELMQPPRTEQRPIGFRVPAGRRKR